MRLVVLVMVVFTHDLSAQTKKPPAQIKQSTQTDQTTRVDHEGNPLPKGALKRFGTLRYQLIPSNTENANDFVIHTNSADALSPDGSVVAFAHDRSRSVISLLDTSTGKRLQDLTAKFSRINALQFSANGDHLIVNDDGNIALIELSTGKVNTIAKVSENHLFAYSSAFGVTPDLQWLAIQPHQHDYHAPVELWHMPTRKKVATLPGRGSAPRQLRFGKYGKRLLLCSAVPSHVGKSSIGFDNRKVALACIDVVSRKIVGELVLDHNKGIALSPNGETVAYEDAKRRNVHVKHLPSGAERCVISAKETSLTFTPDGKALITVSKSGRATLWNVATGKKIREFEGRMNNAEARIVGISNDGKKIVALDNAWHERQIIVVWDGDTGRRLPRAPGHHASIQCVAYSPDGKWLASGSADHTVRLWNVSKAAHLRIQARHGKPIALLAFSGDSKLLASASEEGDICVSQLYEGNEMCRLEGPESGVTALAFSADATTLFAGVHEAKVLAWRIAAPRKTMTFGLGSAGAVLAFAPAGELALLAKEPELYRFDDTKLEPEKMFVWNASSKRTVASLNIRPQDPKHFGSVSCQAAAFSHDSRMIASSQITTMQGIRPSYGFARLCVWERATGQEIVQLSEAITQVLAFSPNGRLVAAGRPGTSGHLRMGYGRGIDIWEAMSGTKIGGMEESPHCLTFSPDGKHIATGGRDHTILIWNAPQSPRLQAIQPASAAQQQHWWNELGGEARHAYKAMHEMLQIPEQTVAFLKQRIEPVRACDPKSVAKLISQLDSEKYIERIGAQAELEKMGEGAAHLLKEVLPGKINLELRLRLGQILKKIDTSSATSVLAMRQHRAVALMEWIGTPHAREVLQTWAKSVTQSQLAISSQNALKRLRQIAPHE